MIEVEKNYFKKDEKNDNILPIYLDGDAILIKFATEISLKDQIIKVKEKIDLIKNTIIITKDKLSNKTFAPVDSTFSTGSRGVPYLAPAKCAHSKK